MEPATQSLQYVSALLVYGYMRRILKHSISTLIPNELILICVSFIEATGKDFIYSSDFDKNGICYALATDFGQHRWANPMNKRLIEVTAEWNYGSGGRIFKEHTGNRDTANSTRNNKNGSIRIDFKSQLIAPTAYSWRHDNASNNYPQNWNFEGSADGNKWHILKKHKNDSQHGINGAFKSHTWRLGPQTGLISYRMFRFRLTGKDSSANKDYPHTIHCSGFEIYGRLIHISQEHEREYQQIITNRELDIKEKQRKEERSEERKRKCEPIKDVCLKLVVLIVVIFVFAPDIGAVIIGIKNECSTATTSNNSAAMGINLYLILGAVIHFVAIGICIAGLWIVLELADVDNYWDDEKFSNGIPVAVCCVGLWTLSWSIVGCILYSKMDTNTASNKACSDIVISWAVLKMLETLGMPFVLYSWAVFFGFRTYDYE